MSEICWSNHSGKSLSCTQSDEELSLEIDPDPRSPITPGCLGPLTDLFNFENIVDRSSKSERDPAPGSSSRSNKWYSSSGIPVGGLSSSSSKHPNSNLSGVCRPKKAYCEASKSLSSEEEPLLTILQSLLSDLSMPTTRFGNSKWLLGFGEGKRVAVYGVAFFGGFSKWIELDKGKYESTAY